MLLNVGFPNLTAAGPNCARAATAGLLGKAACSCWIPAASGVSEADEEKGAPEVRVRCMLVDPKNQTLSRLTGPPMVPPNCFCTTRGTTGLVHPAFCPGAQKLR